MSTTTTASYQNIPGPPRRRPPPPPPRSPSPEPGPPPALPPRKNAASRKEEARVGEEAVGGERRNSKVDESRVDFQSVLQQCREKLSVSRGDDAYTAQLRKLDVKFSGLRGGNSSSSPSSSPSSSTITPPSNMSVLHSRTPTGVSTSYKWQATPAQEATLPPTTTITTTTATSSITVTLSSPGRDRARTSSPRHHESSSSSSSPLLTPKAESRVTVSLASSQKDSLGETMPVRGGLDRETKPVSVTSPSSAAKPPQLPERIAVLPSRDSKPPLVPRADHLPPRGESFLHKDRPFPDFHTKVSDWQQFPAPEVTRERKMVDGHVTATANKPDSGSASPLKDSSRSPAGRRRDVPFPPPPTPPPKDEPDGVGVGVGVTDVSLLPPPPPELLSDSGGGDHFGKGLEQERVEPFADDSYGAYRNRGSRQVGTYKRSSSAAILRPDNQHLKVAGDAQAVFGDRRLGDQAWNSDTQLQSNRKVEVQHGAGNSGINSGAPHRHPDRAGNLPGPARGRVSEFGQPSVQGQGWEKGRDEGRVYAAQPFRVLEHAQAELSNSGDVSSASRLGTDHVDKTVSPSSSLSTPPHLYGSTVGSSSGGQRWANAAPFTPLPRGGGDEGRGVKVPPTSPHSHRVASSRPVVLTDSSQSRDRSAGSSPALSPHPTTSSSHSRAPSERGARHGESSPSSDSKQRFAEVAPFASDSRALPGHTRTYSQSSDTAPPRSAPSPYSRRESAPVSHVPPEAIAMVSPRRKSEDLLDSTVEEEAVLISHGRQPSQEELECDQQAKELAKEVADSEKKLSDVLNADTSKKRMEYMNGLFSGPVEVKMQASVRRHQSHSAGDPLPLTKPPLHGPSVSVDEDQLKKRSPVALHHWVEVERKEGESSSDLTRSCHDNTSLVKHKEEVLAKLQKKVELLKEERKGVQGEMDDNKALGKRISDMVETKCGNASERDKFHTYIADLEKIVRLLLNLSGQLARAEHAVNTLQEEKASSEEKKRAQEKCEGLRIKYVEAKQLKEHVDKRADTVTSILRQWLSAGELKDYSRFLHLQSSLTIHLQQLDDEISLGQQQISELSKSMAESQQAEDSALQVASVPVSS